MKSLIAPLSLLLLTGCLSRPEIWTGGTYQRIDTWREKCRLTFSVDVEGDYKEIHRMLVMSMRSLGWGEDIEIRQEERVDVQQTTMWPADIYMTRWPTVTGFMADVRSTGQNTAQIIVYPVNKWYAAKARQWIQETLGQRTPEV